MERGGSAADTSKAPEAIGYTASTFSVFMKLLVLATS
jgi:hypothetical protein